MKLVDSPAVVLKKKLKYDDMPSNPTPDMRVERPTGEVYVQDVEPHTSTTQPEPDSKTGAGNVRTRKEIPEGGHHVSGGDDPAGAHRRAFIESERRRKEEKTASPSKRVPLKTMAAKSKGV